MKCVYKSTIYTFVIRDKIWTPPFDVQKYTCYFCVLGPENTPHPIHLRYFCVSPPPPPRFLRKLYDFLYFFFWMGVTERGSGPWQGPKYIPMYSGIDAFAVKYVLYSIAFRSRKTKVTSISNHRSSR